MTPFLRQMIMKYIITAIIITLTMIFYGVLKKEKQDTIQTDDQIECEEILEHGYLYQNGKIIEMTKKRITMRGKNNDTKKCPTK